MVGKDEQGDEKERVTLHSSFKVIAWRTSRSLCDANVEGKKKGMKKQRIEKVIHL
jgi:hypothetical protein